MDFVKLLSGAALAIVINVVLGVTIAEFKSEFNKDIFVSGLKKAAGVLFAVAGLYYVGVLLPDIKFEFLGTNASLDELLNMIGCATVALYVVKDLQNLITILGLSTDDLNDDYRG